MHKKACNDERYDYMTQLIQISHLVNFSTGSAYQGGVPEGVPNYVDKWHAVFLHFLLTGLVFVCNCNVEKDAKGQRAL